MVVCQMIKILLGARDDIDKSLTIFQSTLKDLSRFTEKQDVIGPDKSNILSICKLIEVFVRFLERKIIDRKPSSSSFQMDKQLQKEIMRWARTDMNDDILARGILLPVLGQLCTYACNESAGFAVIEKLSEGI